MEMKYLIGILLTLLIVAIFFLILKKGIQAFFP